MDTCARATADGPLNLFRQITATIDLAVLLDLLGEQIEASGHFDGYTVNLLDEGRQNLVCEKIWLPAEHAAMEATLLHYRFPINLPDANNDVFHTGARLVIDAEDLSDFPAATQNRFMLWRLSVLAILPLQCGKDMIGTVMAFRQHGTIDVSRLPEIETPLELFANQIRNALHHSQLKAREQQFHNLQRVQESFRAFATRINSLTSEDLVYEMISREFLRRFAFDIAAILMREDDRLVIKKCTDTSGKFGGRLAAWSSYAERSAYRIDIADGASASAFIRNCRLYFHDVMEVLHLPMAPKDQEVLKILETPRTFLCIPIRRGDEPIGILWLWSLERPVALSDIDLQTIELLSSFISTAIDNAKLYSTINLQNIEIEGMNLQLQVQNEQLNELASRDRLTGLYNYGHFQEELQRRMAEYQRMNGRDPLSLVLVDIDHFKRFNDRCGHPAGNHALVDISARLRRLARQFDTVCRYGGEEFAVILPNCTLDGARHFCERLRIAVETNPVTIDRCCHPMTISAGCAELIAGETPAQFVERADAALYRAKAGGRNQVIPAGQ